MNTEFEDIEDEPLSNDNPIDWYYDGETGNGYANQCMISIFSDYIRKHDLTIKVWGVTFDNERPLVESKKLRLNVIEEDKKA